MPWAADTVATKYVGSFKFGSDACCAQELHLVVPDFPGIRRFRPGRSKRDSVCCIHMQIKPGLSSYAEDADAAAKSLEPLLYQALENVPKELQVTHGPVPAKECPACMRGDQVLTRDAC